MANEIKTYSTYEELERELMNDKDVQNFSGLTDYDDHYTLNVKTKYGLEQRKVRIIEEL